MHKASGMCRRRGQLNSFEHGTHVRTYTDGDRQPDIFARAKIFEHMAAFRLACVPAFCITLWISVCILGIYLPSCLYFASRSASRSTSDAHPFTRDHVSLNVLMMFCNRTGSCKKKRPLHKICHEVYHQPLSPQSSMLMLVSASWACEQKRPIM